MMRKTASSENSLEIWSSGQNPYTPALNLRPYSRTSEQFTKKYQPSLTPADVERGRCVFSLERSGKKVSDSLKPKN
jgi:hypothetical protein